MRRLAFLFALPVLSISAAASAHFTLVAPPSADTSTDGGKGPPPCGAMPAANAVVTPVTGGTMIPFTINETVAHPGFYRVAMALQDVNALPLGDAQRIAPDNTVYDDMNKVLPADGSTKGISDHADFAANPMFPVIADNVFPHQNGGGMMSGMITIPNVSCDKCTLMISEFMASHGYNGNSIMDGGGYYYHHCAYIKVTADVNKPIFDPGGMGGAGGIVAGSGGMGTGGVVAGSGGTGTGGVVAGSSMGGMATSGGSGSGGTGITTAGTTNIANPTTDDGGCGCRVGARTGERWVGALAASLLVGLAWQRRRRNRAA